MAQKLTNQMYQQLSDHSSPKQLKQDKKVKNQDRDKYSLDQEMCHNFQPSKIIKQEYINDFYMDQDCLSEFNMIQEHLDELMNQEHLDELMNHEHLNEFNVDPIMEQNLPSLEIGQSLLNHDMIQKLPYHEIDQDSSKQEMGHLVDQNGIKQEIDLIMNQNLSSQEIDPNRPKQGEDQKYPEQVIVQNRTELNVNWSNQVMEQNCLKQEMDRNRIELNENWSNQELGQNCLPQKMDQNRIEKILLNENWSNQDMDPNCLNKEMDENHTEKIVPNENWSHQEIDQNCLKQEMGENRIGPSENWSNHDIEQNCPKPEMYQNLIGPSENWSNHDIEQNCPKPEMYQNLIELNENWSNEEMDQNQIELNKKWSNQEIDQNCPKQKMDQNRVELSENWSNQEMEKNCPEQEMGQNHIELNKNWSNQEIEQNCPKQAMDQNRIELNKNWSNQEIEQNCPKQAMNQNRIELNENCLNQEMELNCLNQNMEQNFTKQEMNQICPIQEAVVHTDQKFEERNMNRITADAETQHNLSDAQWCSVPVQITLWPEEQMLEVNLTSHAFHINEKIRSIEEEVRCLGEELSHLPNRIRLLTDEMKKLQHWKDYLTEYIHPMKALMQLEQDRYVRRFDAENRKYNNLIDDIYPLEQTRSSRAAEVMQHQRQQLAEQRIRQLEDCRQQDTKQRDLADRLQSLLQHIHSLGGAIIALNKEQHKIRFQRIEANHTLLCLDERLLTCLEQRKDLEAYIFRVRQQILELLDVNRRERESI